MTPRRRKDPLMKNALKKKLALLFFSLNVLVLYFIIHG
jgi:hypothetical protein